MNLEPLANPPSVRLYVCGPTVYDDAHLGHARCYITWDVLYRFLRFLGYDVQYTRNITDVDDKILNRSRENRQEPKALAEKYTQKFHDVMDRLNVEKPSKEPKATEYVSDMISWTELLIKKGYAYSTPSGNVYFDTSRKKNYGNLCHQNLEDLQSGTRIEVDPEKRSPLDFALWKTTEPGEPPYAWSSPWGWGRPGWHIECSVMSNDSLGSQIDIHAGGMDLIFPHHQNEIAQSEAFTEKEPFVRIWMHNGFVNVSGEKMSKSLGNFSTIEKLLETYDANTLRCFILQHGYRSPIDFNDEALEGPKNRIKRFNFNIQWLLGKLGCSTESIVAESKKHILSIYRTPPEKLTDWEESAIAWIDAMAEDLNTAVALEQLDKLLGIAVKEMEESEKSRDLHLCALGVFLALAEIMGFKFSYSFEFLLPRLQELYKEISAIVKAKDWILKNTVVELNRDWSVDKIIDEICFLRSQARDAKDWAFSDCIRDRLLELDIHLKDTKDKSFRWHYEPSSALT